MTRWLPFAALGLFLLPLSPVQAQLPQVRLNAVFPPGGTAGTTVRVTVTDSPDNDELAEMLFSETGITAQPAKNDAGAVIANQFDVTIAETVAPGYYDLRVRGLFGVSNPRTFRVGRLAQIVEAEPNNETSQTQAIALNQVVYARSYGAGDVDRYSLDIKAGQTLVLRTEAARLDSLMQPVMEVFNDAGRRIRQARRALDQEAVLVVSSDRDQTLTVTIRDMVYGGGQTFGYRFVADTRPLVDFVWPPAVPAGVESVVMLYGRHLPGGEKTDLTIDGAPLYRRPQTVGVLSAGGASSGLTAAASVLDTRWWQAADGNLLPLMVGRAGVPVYRDTDPVTQSGPQLTGSFSVAGHFPARGEDRPLRFYAKKGEVRDIQVYSQRLGIPANALLYVEQITTAEDGSEQVKLLATEVDGRQNPGGAQLPTFTTDPAWRLTAPADGLYQIRVRNRYAGSKASARNLYVVDVHSPQPGFELLAMESIASTDGKAPVTTGAVSLRRGGHYEIPVYVLREQGHSAAITLTAEDLPAGVQCLPAVIPAGKTGTKLLLTATDDAAETTGTIRIVGTSGDLKRTAHVSTLLHAGFNGLPRSGRVTQALVLNVMKDVQPFTVTLGTPEAVLHQDQQLLIPVTLTRRNGFNGKVDVAFTGQPGNVDVAAVSFAPDATTATARLFFKENAGTGPAQLLAYATGPVKYRRNPWKAERAHAEVAAAQQKIDEQQKIVADAGAKAEAAMAEVTAATQALEALKKQQAAEQAAIAELKQQLAAAAAEQGPVGVALQQLKQAQLAAATAATNPEAAAGDLAKATMALQAATEKLTQAQAQVAATTKQLQTALAKATQNLAQREAAQAAMKPLQEKLKQAQAAVAAEKAKVEKLTAAKTSAAEAAKKADEATKAKDVNVRAVSTPVQLSVFATPGKLTAAVPGGGAIKRGASIEVPVTLVRKNKFAGAVNVSLVVPDGSGLTAAAVEIAADQTTAKLTISAAADAAVAEIAHAVLRATTEFNGRAASFDVPVTLKVSE